MAATMRAAPTNPYAAFLQQQQQQSQQPAAESVSESDATAASAVDDATMGVPMDTRNYQELLRQAGAPPTAVTVRGTSTREQRRATTPGPRFAVLLGGGSTTAGEPSEDATVHGLPVDTCNYEAFALHGGVPPPPYVASPLEHSLSVDEEASGDTVYGLPISTGNYEAIVGAGAKVKKSRVRGHSDQGQAVARRASAPALHDPPRHVTMPSASPATIGVAPRGSCFETRRATTVAVVPYSGWLYIQSNTLKQWKKHYAVLSGVDFKYSKGVGQPPKGFGTVRSIEPWNGKSHGFIIVLTTGRQLPVYCQSSGEVENWTHAFQKSLDKLQNLSGHSKTAYTMAASENHEGYMYLQDSRATTWRPHYFIVRTDGYLECKVTEDETMVDSRNSGYVKSVSFADVHPNGLAIQLDAGTSMLVYTETYDERMLWYAAMSSGALANDRTPHGGSASSVKSTYVQTARANHAGWLFMQSGLFKSWKRFYFTLHGAEVSFSKDTNSPVLLCDKVRSADDWLGKQNGLEIRLKSGRVWRVYADSYDSAKRWRTLMQSAIRQNNGEFNVKRYLASRKRKGLSPVFGGWLTSVRSNGTKLRQFYVVDGNVLGDASEVDHQLQPIGRVVEVHAARDMSCGLVVTFLNGSKLRLAVDSLDSHKSWYEVLKASL